MGDGPLSQKYVTDYLKANRGFLEHHVLEHVDSETLERWYIRRVQMDKANRTERKHSDDGSNKKISLSRWKVRNLISKLKRGEKKTHPSRLYTHF